MSYKDAKPSGDEFLSKQNVKKRRNRKQKAKILLHLWQMDGKAKQESEDMTDLATKERGQLNQFSRIKL